MWDVNYGAMLRHKDIQINRLQAIKESTPGLNNYIGIKTTLPKHFTKNKR